jgi:hypothetical protein
VGAILIRSHSGLKQLHDLRDIRKAEELPYEHWVTTPSHLPKIPELREETGLVNHDIHGDEEQTGVAQKFIERYFLRFLLWCCSPIDQYKLAYDETWRKNYA